MSITHLPGLQLCTHRDLDSLGDVLANAFFDYPEMLFYFPEPKTHLRDTRWLFRNLLRVVLDIGAVYSDPQCHSCMVILPPGITTATHLQFVLADYWQYFSRYGLPTTFKIIRYNNLVDTFHDTIMAEREHYYLWMLAVYPSLQGTGLGKYLLQPLCDSADALGVPIYLETHLSTNVAYYEHFAFICPGPVESAGYIPFWPMLREPS
jgi:GNAT superfamily N-acetyltransferase